MLGEMTNIDFRTRLGYDYDNPEWLRCSSSYFDAKTHIINKLIYGLYGDDILSTKSTLHKLYLIKNYNHRYTIVFEFNGEYRNTDIIPWILISTVDKILEWWDITNRNNLDIEYVTRGGRPINQNYYRVMWESYTNNNRFRGLHSDGIDERHPRFKDMCSWMYNHNYHEYNQVINRTHTPYDPYRNRENPLAQELIQQRAQYRGLGIQPGYSDYNRGGEDFYQQVQQISQYYNGGHRQEEPIVERVSSINRLRKILKI